MTIEDLKSQNLIILECISGSRAYGLHTPDSDTDIKGVFILPKSEFYSLNYIPQISNETNDIVYYEFGRFMELLSLNNPNILELIATSKESIIFKHPYLKDIDTKQILSKCCEQTFGKFALSQIKKAKGLNKKIVNPIDKERKSILDFCYVNQKHGSVQLPKYLEEHGWEQENCGLVKIAHMKDIYGLYYSELIKYKGIEKHKESNNISLSSIPKGEQQHCLMYFNIDGYSSYCKEYKAYWDWVKHRNESRYENTKSHGKNYDSKNMMHTFRLLEMAIEIANDQKINVKRHDRDYLLKIKSGFYEYDELLILANSKQEEMELAFKNSNLPDKPNMELLKDMTFEIRSKFYSL